jgi:hypothetical protein
MQTRTKLFTAGAGILGVAALALVLQPAFAYQGDPNQKGSNYSPERHQQMEKAFENNDYEAWKSLMNNRGRVTQVVNKDNFNRFAEAHRLAEQGKTEEAKNIKQELGLGMKNGRGKGMGAKKGNRGANCPHGNRSK